MDPLPSAGEEQGGGGDRVRWVRARSARDNTQGTADRAGRPAPRGGYAQQLRLHKKHWQELYTSNLGE